MPNNAILKGDGNIITIVVRNLLTNAVKFTGEGGKVTLEITSPSPSKGGEKECAENSILTNRSSSNSSNSPYFGGGRGEVFTISITDTGVGMTPEQMQNLFHIDRQSATEGTAGEPSSGLGLIVCRDLLQKHGCKLNVESEAGKGSKFWFEVISSN